MVLRSGGVLSCLGHKETECHSLRDGFCSYTLGFLVGYCEQELLGSEAAFYVLPSVHVHADCSSTFFQEIRQHEAIT